MSTTGLQAVSSDRCFHRLSVRSYSFLTNQCTKHYTFVLPCCRLGSVFLYQYELTLKN